MITLAPRESKHEDLPEQVGGIDVLNETIASLDLKIEVEDQRLKVYVQGIYIGKTQEAPFEGTQKKWSLG
jgi:hypothetical protein